MSRTGSGDRVLGCETAAIDRLQQHPRGARAPGGPSLALNVNATGQRATDATGCRNRRKRILSHDAPDMI